MTNHLSALASWLRKPGGTTALRFLAIHAAAFAGLICLWAGGLLVTVFRAGGGIVGAVLALAVVHAVVGAKAAHQLDKGGESPDAALSWLQYIDGCIPIVGFVGTLLGAIVELTSIDPTATGAGMVVMLKNVLGGVGIAVYCTLAGAAVALWTATATAVLANAMEAKKKTDFMAGLKAGIWNNALPPPSSPSRCVTVPLGGKDSVAKVFKSPPRKDGK